MNSWDVVSLVAQWALVLVTLRAVSVAIKEGKAVREVENRSRLDFVRPALFPISVSGNMEHNKTIQVDIKVLNLGNGAALQPVMEVPVKRGLKEQTLTARPRNSFISKDAKDVFSFNFLVGETHGNLPLTFRYYSTLREPISETYFLTVEHAVEGRSVITGAVHILEGDTKLLWERLLGVKF